MSKKIVTVFLLFLMSFLVLVSVNKVEASVFELEGDGGINTSDICYGSGCLNTTPDSIGNMNWTAPINNFLFFIPRLSTTFKFLFQGAVYLYSHWECTRESVM